MLEAWGEHLRDGAAAQPAHRARLCRRRPARLLSEAGIERLGTASPRLDGPALRRQLALRRAEGLVNASAARELSALKGFIAFARSRSGGDAAPPRLRGPRLKKGLPRPITPDEAVNLADFGRGRAAEDWIGARDRAVLLLMYGAGLRIAEALSLTGGDVPLGETLLVTGKGGKQRVVPLLPLVRAAVADYAARCPWPLAKDEPLFRGAKGGPLGQGMVQKAVARARIVLGLPATPRRTRCATASPPTCSARARTCGACRSCSATPASARPRSTPRSMPRRCSTPIATRTARGASVGLARGAASR